jgi:hypothetical protein
MGETQRIPRHGSRSVADKFTQLMTEALSRAAADPGGVPLYAGKTEPGLFPTTGAAKPAAQRCLDEGYLQIIRTETRGKQTVEICRITDAGLQFLLERHSPREVLEDFVRVLEARQDQVDTLLHTARHMAEGICGLRDTVAAILPRMVEARVPIPGSLSAVQPPHAQNGHSPATGLPRGAYSEVPPVTGSPVYTPRRVKTPQEELAGAILTHLFDWAASAGAGQDCPLPELYRALSPREQPPTIGEFHDCLRQLHARRQVYLHPWTGPLYTMPEPTLALLVGHEVAYYASARQGG